MINSTDTKLKPIQLSLPWQSRASIYRRIALWLHLNNPFHTRFTFSKQAYILGSSKPPIAQSAADANLYRQSLQAAQFMKITHKRKRYRTQPFLTDTVAQLVKKLLAFYGLQYSMGNIPNQKKPVHNLISFLSKINFNIILTSFKWSLSVMSSCWNFISDSQLYHACHTACPFNPLWFDYPNNIWRKVEITKLTVRRSLLSCCFPSPNAPCPVTPSKHDFPQGGLWVSLPYRINLHQTLLHYCKC